jgi:PKD repeat protein
MKFRFHFALLLAFFISNAAKSQTWEPLGPVNPQVDNLCHAMSVDTINDQLIVGGRFSIIDGNFYNNMALWDGANWSALPHMGPGGWAEQVVYYDSCIWVNGNFASAGGVLLVQFDWARHTPTGWDIPTLLGPGTVGYFDTADSLIYLMGGAGDVVKGVNAETNVVYSPFPGSHNGDVRCLLHYQGDLYVSGGFTTLASNPNANHFAYLDGSNNVQPVGGYGCDGQVIEMIEYQGDLIAAGDFNVIAGDSITNIARYDGSNWYPLGLPPDGAVTDLEVHDGWLYAAGEFDTIGGVYSRKISKWNGQYWKKVGNIWYNLSGSDVNDIEVYNDELYICGDFQAVGGIFIDHIAKMVDSDPDAQAMVSDTIICVGDNILFEDRSWGPADSILWEFTGGTPTTSTLLDQSVTWSAEGIYTVTHVAHSQLGSDTSTYTIYVGGPTAAAGPDTLICTGMSTALTASGGTQYLWTPSTGLSADSIANPVATPTVSTTYTVLVTDSIGCSATDTVLVEVSAPVAAAGPDTLICTGTSTALTASGGIQYLWTPSTGLSADTIANPVATPTVSTTYTVLVTDSVGCSATDTVLVEISLPVIANFTMDNTAVSWSSGVVNFQDLSAGGTSWEWNFGDGQISNLQSPSHTYVLADTFDVMQIVWNDDGCSDTFFIADAIIVFDDSNVSEQSSHVEFVVSPNPAHEYINVTWSSPFASKTAVEVIDLSGRVVFTREIARGTQQLEVGCKDLHIGTYFIKFSNGNGMFKSLTFLVAH